MKEKFATAEELYEYVLPALKVRVKKLKEKGISMEEKELWTLLSKHWKNGKNLTLYDIVEDILYYTINIE